MAILCQGDNQREGNSDEGSESEKLCGHRRWFLEVGWDIDYICLVTVDVFRFF